MQVKYRNKQVEKVCTNASAARKKYGNRMAQLISQRIGEIRSASTVEMMIECRIGKCHALKGDREGQYAVNLLNAQRLVFTKDGDTVQVVTIEEIVDYH